MSNANALDVVQLNEAMTLSKEKIYLRHVIASEKNTSTHFGSVSSVTILEIFLLIDMVKIGTSGETTL